MVIKKYTCTAWMKGKNFVLAGLGMNSERDDRQVTELIEQAGGIIRSSTVLETDYVIYDPIQGVDTRKYRKAVELMETRGLKITMMTVDEFHQKVNDPVHGQEECIPVGSVICLLEGDQTRCWVQKLWVIYSTVPLEDAKLIFEIYNAARGEYAMAAEDDMDTSYAGLYGLEDEILAARRKLKENTAVDKQFLTRSDGEVSFAQVIASNPGRYASVRKYFDGQDEADEGMQMFDFSALPAIEKKSCYWIDLCRVTKDEFRRYASELHHVYTVAELFDPDDLPFDLNDPATVSIFGTNRFEAFADLSYGC